MPAPTISTAAFDRLILPHAPGAPLPLIRLHARQAAMEFCERTRCWREVMSLPITEENEVFIAPTHAAIHRIEEALADTGSGLYRLTPTQYTDVSHMSGRELTGGSPQYLAQVQHNSVALIPFSPCTLQISLFLKPREGSEMSTDANGETVDLLDQVPAFLETQFGETIACGALARTLLMPGQPFHEPNRALYYRQKFDNACDNNFATDVRMQNEPRRRTRMYEY